MFRLLRVKPPHGWNAVVWELAIVTLGVLMALAAQQWADERDWRGKVATGKAALREELSEQYGYAVEFRIVYPCMQAQLARLRDRVLASAAVLTPAPIYTEPDYQFVVRIPSKEYSKEAWEAATNDAIIQRLDPALRRNLATHYAVVGSIRHINLANDESEQGLFTLAHRLPLDPAVRFAIVKDIELLSGRLELLDTLNREAMKNIRNANMDPPAHEAEAVAANFGTYKFCRAEGLPMLSFSQATAADPT